MKTLILIPLLLAFNLSAAWLTWDRNAETNVIGYKVYWYTNLQSGEKVFDCQNTNVVWLPRLRLISGLQYFLSVTAYNEAGESDFSDEVNYTRPLSTNVYVPVTNIVLRVPSGKYYVESSDKLPTWLAMMTVIGPTNVSCSATNAMGFYRWRPFFVSALSAKRGKLTASTTPIFAKPKPIIAPSDVANPNPIGRPPSLPKLP